MKIEDAKRLYAIGGESKDIALIYFSEDQLKERTLPKTWEEYQENFNRVGDERFAWTSGQVPFNAYSAFYALAKLYMLKQKYNGDWVADWKNENQNKWVLYFTEDQIMKDCYSISAYFLAFPTPELRDQFYANFADLIEAAKPLLG